MLNLAERSKHGCEHLIAQVIEEAENDSGKACDPEIFESWKGVARRSIFSGVDGEEVAEVCEWNTPHQTRNRHQTKHYLHR